MSFIVSMLLASNAAADFSAEIKLVVKGKYPRMTHRLTHDRLVITEHSLNAGPDIVRVNRALSAAEKRKAADFMASFPLAALRKSYVAENAEAEGHLTFDVQIGRERKSIMVYAAAQKDLRGLVALIDSLSPKDYQVWYVWPD